MREPRLDIFGNELPPRWEDRFEGFMYALPEWMQPLYALLFFAAIGMAIVFTIAIIMYGLDGIRWSG